MPFQELPTLICKHGKNAGKPAAVGTVKIYRSILNKLADRGYDTVDKLIQNPTAVNNILEILNSRTKRALT